MDSAAESYVKMDFTYLDDDDAYRTLRWGDSGGDSGGDFGIGREWEKKLVADK